jgi:hypothetical protein
MRRGERMSCHPTDPRSVPKAAALAETHECAGALVLIQREIVKLSEFPGPHAFRLYRKAHPRGLTKEGVAVFISRTKLANMPIVGGPKMPLLDLMTPVSHPPLGDWGAWLEKNPQVRDWGA